MPLGRSGVQQENKKENGVKTEDSVPAAPGDDVMHRLDVELGRNSVPQHGMRKIFIQSWIEIGWSMVYIGIKGRGSQTINIPSEMGNPPPLNEKGHTYSR